MLANSRGLRISPDACGRLRPFSPSAKARTAVNARQKKLPQIDQSSDMSIRSMNPRAIKAVTIFAAA
ncbi:hypothetical protein SAMN05444581_106169 [Methylocapsa palsarum]|uniref:Uncharacterized protein n=1 Tax=Methylocapsa palsarum TaxID=1612308 RepID=A0A1I3YUW1_9HYPH|nr:hypothetical protein SAMN05444581_106169 [Methylocapsa palsarum]